MILPKYCIYKSTKERVKVADADFDKKTATVIDMEEHTYFVPFQDIEFEYSDMDLDDMYVFLRALYSPKEVVTKMCEARGIV